MTDLQIRIDALEIKAAHQEQQIQDLSEMVSNQWKNIERLGGQLSKATAKIESLENSEPNSAPSLADDKPPHY
ncbi:MAG: SlyX family protein [Kordiimonadaceae bacterium]|nr:SlyX family protein [Kordiimonadaceae bacterium]MBT6031534.1 SlyX family protein [Kordiimonadaceae bacterium]